MDVVHLNPYGTTALFIDAAMGPVHDQGLLCETCMNPRILGTTNYLTCEMVDLDSTAHARYFNGSTSLRACTIGGRAVQRGYTVCAYIRLLVYVNSPQQRDA